jgi:hydroxymethylbilane synthase
LKLRIASRKSALAQVQTDRVIELIGRKHGISCDKLLIETKGDRILDVALEKIGGKGLFVKEIELAMQEGSAHAAVHSMKDVPYEMPEGFEIAAVLLREDVRDVFVSLKGISFYHLPKGARVGTSSTRRKEHIRHLAPDVEVVPIRGNVQTRIKKIETEGLDGIILAAAGLKRLGLAHLITDYFEPEDFVPSIGQGALGVEALSSSPHIELFRALDDLDNRLCVEAERSFMKALNGDCHTAIGAYGWLEQEVLQLIGVYAVDGCYKRLKISGPKQDAISLGQRLAYEILHT